MPVPRLDASVREAAGAPADPSARSLRAEVMAVRWRAPEGGFAVVAALTDEGDEVTLTGTLDHLHEGETLEASRRVATPRQARLAVRGAAGPRPRPGERRGAAERARRRQARRAQRCAVAARSSRARTCSSCVDREPRACLREVPGIGPARIGAAVRSWEKVRGRRALRLFLAEHGVPGSAASRIERAFGPEAIDMLREDPYAASQVEGVGFATADALARALGTDPQAPGTRSTRACCTRCEEAGQDGNCLLPREELSRRASALLGADVSDRLDELVARGLLVADGDLLADPSMDRDRAPSGAPRARAGRRRPGVEARPRRATRRRAPSCRPTTSGPSSTRCSRARLSILTGGPGTGKTATMRALVDLVKANSRTRAALRADRQGRPSPGGVDGRSGDDDPPAARLGPRRGLRARRRRPDPRHRRARRRRGEHAVDCSSPTR